MQIEIVGVRFKSSQNVYSFSPNGLDLKVGDKVIVEKERGDELATVFEEKKLVEANLLNDTLKNVLRLATDKEVHMAFENNKIAKGYVDEVIKIVKELGLDMKVISTEANYDFSRLTVNFTSEERVDFRVLAKKLAEKFKKRVELRQIGPRDAVRELGGIGMCGKECCCKQGYGQCDHISIKMAKNQNLSLNPNSISGLCGKLLCCLSYENENYVEALKEMPKVNSFVKTPDGKGKVAYNDLFKKIVTVKFEKDGVEETKEYALSQISFDKEKQ